jgi:hypothetical protein
MREMLFQHDIVTAHTGRVSMEVVRRMFPDIWSPVSAMLLAPTFPWSICDFLWGYRKSRVYMNRTRTIEELKLSICQDIAAVPQKVLERAMQNFERFRMCPTRRTSSEIFCTKFGTNFKNALKTFFLCN